MHPSKQVLGPTLSTATVHHVLSRYICIDKTNLAVHYAPHLPHWTCTSMTHINKQWRNERQAGAAKRAGPSSIFKSKQVSRWSKLWYLSSGSGVQTPAAARKATPFWSFVSLQRWQLGPFRQQPPAPAQQSLSSQLPVSFRVPFVSL
jgi:hypothetical protein